MNDHNIIAVSVECTCMTLTLNMSITSNYSRPTQTL